MPGGGEGVGLAIGCWLLVKCQSPVANGCTGLTKGKERRNEKAATNESLRLEGWN